MLNHYRVNTLRYDESLCINCGMCTAVCPHGVFAPNGRVVRLVQPQACMECGACQENCPTGAIAVESGVGCAAAMMWAALTGAKDASCGPGEGASSCCGEETAADTRSVSPGARDGSQAATRPATFRLADTVAILGTVSCCGSTGASACACSSPAASAREAGRTCGEDCGQ